MPEERTLTVGSDEIDNPSWKKVEAALKKLAGKSEDRELCLHGDSEDTYLIVSCDPKLKLYYVSGSWEGESDYHEVFDRTKKPKRVEALVGGQNVDWKADSLVEIKTATQALRYFYDRQERDPKLSWRVATV